MSVSLDKIRVDGGTQSRAAINDATVAEYAEAMADPNTVFPPVIVYFDGKEYWLADGFHRLAAWAQIGRTDIPTEIRQGDRRQAVLHSVAANSTHGLRRTNDDKRRAVLTLLEDAEWSLWSNREIARRCGVSEGFVRSLREPICAQNADNPVRTVERNGTTYQQNTTNIGVKPTERVMTTGEEITPKPEQNKAETPLTKLEENQPDEAPETAKARKALAGLTREGLEDEVIGLRADLADSKAEARKAKAEIADLKEKLRDFDGDSAEVIRRLQKAADYERSKAWKATEEQGRLQKQIYALKKRVSELEGMEIQL